MSELASQTPLGPDPSTRIMHVLDTADSVVVEMARETIARHLQAGYPTAVAARRNVFDSLGLDTADPLLVHIEIGAVRGIRVSDASHAFTLHKYYRHVDLVHAHGLHAGALAGLALTGLPQRRHPAIITTVERFDESSTVDTLLARTVARTSTAVLGTTDPVCEYFADLEVPVTERAPLLRPDLDPRGDLQTAITRDRKRVRRDLDVPAGHWLIASPIEMRDGTDLTTVLDAAIRLPSHRPDRRWVVAFTGGGAARDQVSREIANRFDHIRVASEYSAAEVAAAADLVIAADRMTGLSTEGLMQMRRPVVHIGRERGARIWGESVTHVAADDTPGLLAAIADYVDNPAARATAAVAAKDRVAASTSVDTAGLILLDIYDTVLGMHAGTRPIERR